MRKAVAGVALLLFATVLVGCGNGPDHTITGTVDVIQCPTSANCSIASRKPAAGPSRATACRGGGAHGYSDVVEGAPITVRTTKGRLLATGHLGAGSLVAGACRLPFAILHVRDAHTYVIEIAHEGGQTFTKAHLAADDYHLDLPLEPAPR